MNVYIIKICLIINIRRFRSSNEIGWKESSSRKKEGNMDDPLSSGAVLSAFNIPSFFVKDGLAPKTSNECRRG